MAKNWKESDLEQYTVNNLDKLKSCLFSSSKIEMNLIGTQIKCTFGRIDMLAWAERSLMVIEFKAVHAGETRVSQGSYQGFFCKSTDQLGPPNNGPTQGDCGGGVHA